MIDAFKNVYSSVVECTGKEGRPWKRQIDAAREVNRARDFSSEDTKAVVCGQV